MAVESIGLVASLVTLLELAGTAKSIAEGLAEAPRHIASLAKDITRSGDSLILLAGVLSDSNVQKRCCKRR